MRRLTRDLFFRAGIGLSVLVVCLVSVGCGRARREAQQRQDSNLKPLAILYGQFLGRHEGRPPADEQEFKQFIRSSGSEQLARFDVADLESLFISSRDQKPYVVLYGDEAPLGSARVVAYEREGQGGTRFVANDLGEIRQVDEAQFRAIVPSPP